MKKDLQEVRVGGFGGGMEWNLEKRNWKNERKNTSSPPVPLFPLSRPSFGAAKTSPIAAPGAFRAKEACLFRYAHTKTRAHTKAALAGSRERDQAPRN